MKSYRMKKQKKKKNPPTVFDGGQEGINHQKLWMQEHYKMLLKKYIETESEIIIVLRDNINPGEARVNFLKNFNEFFQSEINDITVKKIKKYIQEKKADNKFIIIFLRDEIVDYYTLYKVSDSTIDVFTGSGGNTNFN